MNHMKNKNKNYPFNIEGIKTIKSERDHIICHIDTSGPGNPEIISKLFDELPFGLYVSFFDNYHPTISDPGAYVSAYRLDDRFVYDLGNHGWSSKKYWTTKDYLANYLIKNWNYNNDILCIENGSVNLERENVINESLWEPTLTEIARQEGKYTLFEVNGNFLLSVICGNVALFEINVILDSLTTAEYKEKGVTIIESLAEKISSAPYDYIDKNIEIRKKEHN